MCKMPLEEKMIDTLLVRDFKSLRHIQIGLARFTVIVGPNGSGKSSILQALNGLCCAFHGRHSEVDDVLLVRSRNTPQGAILLAGQFGIKAVRFRSAIPDRGTGPSFETSNNIGSEAWTHWHRPGDEPVPLPKSVLLQLDPKNLSSTQVNHPDSSTMSSNGTGLHVALANIALNTPDVWPLFLKDLQAIHPFIKRLRHARTSVNAIPELLFDTVVADSLDARQMSEGTLLAVGLLAALYSPECPKLVLIDDLDHALHPKAQRDLVALLRRLLERRPDLQIVASTHSPYLLNWMAPEEVLVTCLADDGSTACAGIDSHPQFAKWKDEMLPGEMWSMFGERWTIPARAAG